MRKGALLLPHLTCRLGTTAPAWQLFGRSFKHAAIQAMLGHGNGLPADVPDGS